jgi:hypothetical protein
MSDKNLYSQVLVAHTFNPSYSGDRDQEDDSLKPVQTNSLRDPISKHPVTKNWAGGMAQGEGPKFKSQYCKKKRNCYVTLWMKYTKSKPSFHNRLTKMSYL